MIILEVPEIHCLKCVERITKALEEDKLTFSVSLEDKTVSIDGCQNCAATAIATLDDLGFTATIRK
ncbi:MAG: metal-binding protein [Spirochaetaceae bacterium]|nr:metal-binding protein [Spirochaetaceae bacterium]